MEIKDLPVFSSLTEKEMSLQGGLSIVEQIAADYTQQQPGLTPPPPGTTELEPPGISEPPGNYPLW